MYTDTCNKFARSYDGSLLRDCIGVVITLDSNPVLIRKYTHKTNHHVKFIVEDKESRAMTRQILRNLYHQRY